MPRKKVTKQRGHKTHGWGSKKKHRGGGSRGGRGRGGIVDQKKIQLLKKGIRTGKRGFKSMRHRGLRPYEAFINLKDVERLAGEKKEINLGDHGYQRVLGTGRINRPLTVKARYFSAKAKDKIEKAGGKVIADGQESAEMS
jgi:large subunit ribosomal protein L15